MYHSVLAFGIKVFLHSHIMTRDTPILISDICADPGKMTALDIVGKYPIPVVALDVFKGQLKLSEHGPELI